MDKFSKIAADVSVGPLRGQGNLGFEDRPTFVHFLDGPKRLEMVISVVIGTLTVIAFILFVIKILTGGIAIVTAGGDKGKVAAGRDDITYGVIGLVIVVSAIFIAGIVGAVIGVDVLEINNSIRAIMAIT
ncbi:hypothetical protein IPM62_00465 [Candidatus Woesebacteria bacterium]|nr:MAG: hypothetical protein IPM62_00465 [Candidatus Woesebacteria bacterium]